MSSSYLTRKGYEKLQQELEHLRTEKRQEISVRLQEAMEDGELIENAEYEDAKNEQAFVEGHIKELELLLANARVIEMSKKKRENVQVGCKVTVKEDGLDPEKYFIVGPAEADPRIGRISNESPLGKSLLNHKAGDKVKVEAPGGAFMVEIVKIS